LGFLRLGIYITVAAAFAALIYSIILAVKSKDHRFKKLLQPALIMFVFFYLLSIFNTSGIMLISNDEFSHWGLMVKNMYLTGSFPQIQSSNLLFYRYPPMLSVFKYFIVFFQNKFVESHLYLAGNVLYFSLVIVLFDGIKWKQYKQVIIRFFLILLVPLLFKGSFFQSILSDGILGVMYAMALVYWFMFKKDKGTFTLCTFLLVFLGLSKASGLGLAIMAALMIAADIILDNGKRTNGEKFFEFSKYKRILFALLPIAIIILSNLTWFIYSHLSSFKGDSSTLLVQGILNLSGGCIKPYYISVLQNFLYSLSKAEVSNYILNMTWMSWLAVFGLLGVYLYKLFSKNAMNRKSILVFIIGFFISFFGYMIFLLLTYLLSFSEYQAVKLASFDRYTYTYFIAISTAFIFAYVIGEHKLKKKTRKSVVLFCLVIILVQYPILAELLLYPQNVASHTQSVRESYNAVENLNDKIDFETDKLMVVNLGEGKYNRLLSNYNNTPYLLADEAERVGLENSKTGDETLLYDTPEDWINEISEQYDYVYICELNDTFISDFKDVFEGEMKEHTLYEPTILGDTVVLKIVIG